MISLILIGGGGHCESCIDVIEQQGKYKIEGIVDLSEKIGSMVSEYQIISDDSKLEALAEKYPFFLVTIGQINTPDRRMDLCAELKRLKVQMPVIISPHAYVSKHSQIKSGTVIHHHALVNSGTKIGNHCIINTRAVVEHNAVVGDFVHISTGSILNGGVSVGSGSFVGSGTIVKEGVKIGKNCVVSSGIRIMHDVESGEIVRSSH